MKKTLLIVAMLLLVTPVMATTTVKVLVNPADQTNPLNDGNRIQPVSIAYVTDVNVRAFALDINIDAGPSFQNIRNFKTGESNGASTGGSSGYGIFPSRFRDFIVVTGPNWVDPNYNPTVAWNEPETTDHNSGMGWPKMIVEMGTLFAGDANKPAWSGTLFKFDVNSGGAAGTFHISVKANTLRGGVVNQDGNSILPPTLAFEPCDVSFAALPCTLPDVVSQPEATATDAITAAGFTLGTRTQTCSDVSGIVAGDIISTTPVAGVWACGISVDYVVSTGPCTCTVPNVVSQPEATATGNITAAGFILGTRTTTCSNVSGIIVGDIVSTTPGAGAQPCGTAVAYVVSTGPCCTTIPAILAKSMTDANTAITGASLTIGAITYECNDACAVNKVCRQQTGCVASGSSVWYVVSTGPTTAPGVPASITVPATDADGVYNITWTAGTGATSYQLESSAPASGTTVFPLWVPIYNGTALTFVEKVGGGTWSYRVKSLTACGSSDYRTGGNTCVVADCLKSTDANYAGFVIWRYPACWCASRQCRGDFNAKKTGATYVQAKDLAIFKLAYGKTDAQVAAAKYVDGTLITFGICADLTQKKDGANRVQAKDLTEFKKYYGQPDANVPCCDADRNCVLTSGDRWNYWTAQN